MAKRNKQYRLRMTDEEFEKLETLSHESGLPKAFIIRLALKNYGMMRHYITVDRKAIEEAFRSMNTHAAKSTKGV